MMNLFKCRLLHILLVLFLASLVISLGGDPPQSVSAQNSTTPEEKYGEQISVRGASSFLKRVGEDVDPGVSDARLIIGTVVPTRADLAGLGQAIKAVTAAYFDEQNSHGGIHNRKLELKIAEVADTPAATKANVKRFIQDEQIFAMTGAFTAGADKELTSLMSEMQVPLVGPLTLYPQAGPPLNRHVFYLLSGLDEQARALLNFASQKSADKKTGVAVIYPEGELSAAMLQAIKDQCQKQSCGSFEAYSYQHALFDAASIARRLSQSNKTPVFFLGTGEEAVGLMKEADKLRWSPLIFLPRPGTAKDVFLAPSSFNQKIFLSFPTSTVDHTAEGVAEFRALTTKYKLPGTNLAAQLSAYSAAKILVEGLKRAGKDLSREKLIETLEGFNQYATGLTPAITYGPNRRIGAMGAYVVTIDFEKKQLVPVSEWVPLD